jgi:hypothetical protein
MKRISIVVAFSIITLTNCCGQYTAENIKTTSGQRELLKEYFLCVCITEGFKDKQIAENDISQAVYFDILQYSPEAFQAVKDYAKKFIETLVPSPIEDLGNKSAIILSFIEKYKSKELDKLIKSMDKYLIR